MSDSTNNDEIRNNERKKSYVIPPKDDETDEKIEKYLTKLEEIKERMKSDFMKEQRLIKRKKSYTTILNNISFVTNIVSFGGVIGAIISSIAPPPIVIIIAPICGAISLISQSINMFIKKTLKNIDRKIRKHETKELLALKYKNIIKNILVQLDFNHITREEFKEILEDAFRNYEIYISKGSIIDQEYRKQHIETFNNN